MNKRILNLIDADVLLDVRGPNGTWSRQWVPADFAWIRPHSTWLGFHIQGRMETIAAPDRWRLVDRPFIPLDWTALGDWRMSPAQ